ncbi:MAG: hydroxyacid dehydrogenase [Anaerolineales bacterium]
MKVLIADKLGAEAIDRLRSGGVEPDDRAGIEPSELVKVIAEYEGLIVRSRTKVTAELLQAATKLKVVGRAGVGVDNIDLAAARQHGVAVVNTPTSTSVAVAELTFGLMLALLRDIPRADAAMKAGSWLKKDLEGTELAGKTLGILGVGNIGAQVARRAAAFNMTVVGFDPLLDAKTLKGRGALALSLDGVYAQADVITLHLPLLPETRGLLNQGAFAKMKRGVYLVCAARGGVINEDDLLAALESGQVAGAALDVFEKEPPGPSPLVAHPRIVATPHIGAQTAEAQRRAAVDVADEVVNALMGKPLRWQVR